MLFSAESTFVTFLADAFAVFVFILWFWLFITTASDLFRRSDISGLGKVVWVLLLIVLPYIGIFAYILTQGSGMAERNRMQARQARDELRQIVGFSVADEIAKLERLKSEKAISDQEYARLRARVVQEYDRATTRAFWWRNLLLRAPWARSRWPAWCWQRRSRSAAARPRARRRRQSRDPSARSRPSSAARPRP